MSVTQGIFQWTRNTENSIIQDFDLNTNGNQTVNNNFRVLTGIGGLSENGVIYGFSLNSTGATGPTGPTGPSGPVSLVGPTGSTGSTLLSVEQITLDTFPTGGYSLFLQVYAINGPAIGKSNIYYEPSYASSISATQNVFNNVRILVTAFDEVTGLPVNIVNGYKVFLKS